MCRTKVEILKDDYEKYRNSSPDEIKAFIFDIAVHSGFHPSGYGMYDYHLEEINGCFYAVWDHWNSCD